MTRVNPLSAEFLYNRCDPEQFEFGTTGDLDPVQEVLGQERALAAVRFGMGMTQQGYNLFALGAKGLGKQTAVTQFLQQEAADRAVPPDWCYVFDFAHPQRPNAIKLPAGRGHQLEQDMDKLVTELKAILPAAFESEDYHTQRQVLEAATKAQQEQAFDALQRKARGVNIALIQTPSGLAFAPIQDGEVIKPEAYQQLSEEEQKEITGRIEELQVDLQKIMRQVPQWRKENQEKLQELNEQVAQFTVAPLFEALRDTYAELDELEDYLNAVEKDVVTHVDDFLPQSGEKQPPLAPQAPPSFTRYQVNVLVDHSETQGAPVVFSDLPTYQNLLGRIEHMSQFGALSTNFTLIKAGAVHKANGGYLILDARKLLQQPYAWDGLKRALQSQEINIESLGQVYGGASTITLEPEAIPLNVKVVLIGDRQLYYILVQGDPEFGELFKVMAEFDHTMARSEDSHLAYARLLGRMAREEGLGHLDKAAVARVIEHGTRLAGDQEKVSTHLQTVSNLLHEANYWASEREQDVIGAEDVQKAIDEQVYRAGNISEQMQERILRETIMIDTEGEKVGQINGLAVYSLGTVSFGKPSKISARIRMGKGEVLDIERRAEMGGATHTKGVLILTSFLAGRYALDRPLPLSASLVFEQSYGGVDGDSASSTELYALLSAIADVPITQGLAVTGSVNQYGQVQAIGGVNQKIEGFFDICQARGLTGEQGVLIPTANVKHLMLRQDVVQAVEDGRFHVYAVATIDEGIEILTGYPAGTLTNGAYPKETINYRVIARIEYTIKRQRAYAKPQKKEEPIKKDEASVEPEPATEEEE